MIGKAEKEIIEEIQRRAEFGFSKYGVTTNREDLSLIDWLQHLKEELLDAAIYLQRIMTILKLKEKTFNIVEELKSIENEPNDPKNHPF